MIDPIKLQNRDYLAEHYKELIGYKLKLVVIDYSVINVCYEYAIIKEVAITSFRFEEFVDKVYLDDGNYLYITNIAIHYVSQSRKHNCYFLKE